MIVPGAVRAELDVLFQPAEESLPGGEIGGARRMLEEGAFADPKPDAVFGLLGATEACVAVGNGELVQTLRLPIDAPSRAQSG